MSNKVFIAILIALALAVGTAVYFIYTPGGGQPKSQPFPLEETLGGDEESENVLVKEGFSMDIPRGWAEADASVGGAVALVLNAEEEITDERAGETGFITYYSINGDSLREYTFEEYVEEVKVGLIQTIEEIGFTYEKQGEINGRRAFFVEAESHQQEINFKTLLVFVEAPDGMIWAISFNTLKDKWPEYEDLFYRTAESFKLQLN